MDISQFRLGVVGRGFVGTALVRGLAEHVKQTRVYDLDPRRADSTLDEVMDSDIVFLCLPTPEGKTGACDVSAIDAFFEQLITNKDRWKPTAIVLRSTVPVGTTQRLVQRLRTAGVETSICYNPEFLTARLAITDFHTPSRIILGAPAGDERSADTLFELLVPFFTARFPGVNLQTMTSSEAEFVKLAANTFFAVKLACFNEYRVFCDLLGLDWMSVLGGIVSDGRIAMSHCNVPGPDGQRGFGGACLPKDLANLAACLRDAGCDDSLFTTVRSRNQQLRQELVTT